MKGKNKTIKIPVLMYHDVVAEQSGFSGPDTACLPYNVTDETFRKQLKILADSGYKSILFDEIPFIAPAQKAVIVTFDDGLSGNFDQALPILKEYGFKAVFFVIAGSVGKPGYMTWEQLKALAGNGMSVQSHSVSHESLEVLSSEAVLYELSESRKILERNLGVKVNSISFPHGSYNKEILRAAAECGYEFICTSDMTQNYASSERPAVFGRIAVRASLGLRKFSRLVAFDAREFLRVKLVKSSKTLIRSTIGIKNYGRLYHLFYRAKR